MTTRPTRSSTASAGLTAGHIDNDDQKEMQALVTAGALVALADGRVDPIERDGLVNFIDRQHLVSTISRPEIAEAFDKRVRQLEERSSADVIVETFRPPAGLSLASRHGSHGGAGCRRRSTNSSQRVAGTQADTPALDKFTGQETDCAILGPFFFERRWQLASTMGRETALR